MARFLLFLLILLVGWGLIFLPMLATPGSSLFPVSARPAADLPQPWQSGVSVQISAPSGDGAFLSGGNTACGSAYSLARGDTLGKIAQECRVSLPGLLAANPQIQDPNQVFVGQVINIPALAGRGGGADSDGDSSGGPASFSPGSQIILSVENMPANAAVRIGIGLSKTGYQVLLTTRVGPDGRIGETIVIPTNAVPGDSAFILVSAEGVPSVQVRSPEFMITP